jgi:hypothetical protein
MRPYEINTKSRFKPGQKIRFLRIDGVFANDTVRECFIQECKCAPYGPDYMFPALVLTEHSWCAESDVID